MDSETAVLAWVETPSDLRQIEAEYPCYLAFGLRAHGLLAFAGESRLIGPSAPLAECLPPLAARQARRQKVGLHWPHLSGNA